MNKIKGDREAVSGCQGQVGQVLVFSSLKKKAVTVALSDLLVGSQASTTGGSDSVVRIGDALGLQQSRG